MTADYDRSAKSAERVTWGRPERRAFRATAMRVNRISSSRYWSFVVINPKRPSRYGSIRMAFPRLNIGTVHCIAWLPMPDDHTDRRTDSRFSTYGKYDTVTSLHHGSAWYLGTEQRWNASTYAMVGAEFLNLRTKTVATLDRETSWMSQLESAGYIVAQ